MKFGKMLKSTLKNAIPFIIGLLVGSGLTQNKAVLYLLITYVVVMFIFGIVKDRIKRVKGATDKKQATKDELKDMGYSTAEAVKKGNEMGANKFDRFYKEYAFYFCTAVFITTIVLLVYGEWLWAAVLFLGLNFFIPLNQAQQSIRELKDYIKEKGD